MITINKFMFKPDGETLEINITNDRTAESVFVEGIYKLEIWNFDDPDVKYELDLGTTEPYQAGVDGPIYNVVESVAINLAVASLMLKNTMIRGLLYTIHADGNVLNTYELACSNLRPIYLSIVSDLEALNNSFMSYNSIPIERRRNVNLIENILAAHKDALFYGFNEDAESFYLQLSDLCL